MVVGHSLEVAYPFVATKVIQKLLAIEAIHIKVAFIHIHPVVKVSHIVGAFILGHPVIVAFRIEQASIHIRLVIVAIHIIEAFIHNLLVEVDHINLEVDILPFIAVHTKAYHQEHLMVEFPSVHLPGIVMV